MFVFVLLQSSLLAFRFDQAARLVELQREMLTSSNLQLRVQEKLRQDAEQMQMSLQGRVERSKKMETIGLLAGGVAHDLNNILSEAVTYPELALMDLPDDSPLRRPLEQSRRAGLRAAGVIDDLLSLTRRGIVKREVVDVNAEIREYLRSGVHHTLAQNYFNINLVSELDADLTYVEASRIQLHKMLMNLVSNGFESMAEHGGIVTLRSRSEFLATSRELFYQQIPAGHYVVISLEDEGRRGGDPAKLERLFEPFYTTKAMGRSGTRLGMAVVWGLVTDHGGAIDILTEMGQGSRFDVYLPGTELPLTPPPEPVPLQRVEGHGRKILVVDDLIEQRQLMSDILNKLGYQSMDCDNGEDALSLLERADFELVVLDMVLERSMDGLVVFRHIKARFPGVKVIMASGFAEDDKIAEARALGVNAFLKEPFTVEAFGSTITSVLAGD